MAEVKLEDVPRKVRDLYNRAFAAYERENLDYAMDMFLSVLDLEPGLLSARKYLRASSVKEFRQKGNALSAAMAPIQGLGKMMKLKSSLKKNPVEALKQGELLLRSSPFNKSFLEAYEEAARAADLLEAAILSFEVAKDEFQKDRDFLRRLGKLYMDAGDTAKGRAVYEQIVQMDPKDQDAIKELKDAAAVDTMQSGGWVGAKSYRDVMKDKDEATLLEQENRAVKSGDSSDNLIENAKAKIQREPENINYRRSLADLYIKNENYQAAIQELEEALKISGNADPQIERAISDARVAELENEVEALKEAGDPAAEEKETELEQFRIDQAGDRVQRYPNDLGFKFEYGKLLFKHEFLNEAAQQFQQSQRSPQRRIESLYYLGRCFAGKGQMDIAIEQLKKAVSELPSMDKLKKQILYDLGEMHEKAGQADEAKQAFKEIYSVDIGYRDVAAKIEGS